MAPNGQKGEWLGKRQRARRVPRSQENLRVKDLTEYSGESWVPVRARKGHEGDEQPVENWITEDTEWS